MMQSLWAVSATFYSARIHRKLISGVKEARAFLVHFFVYAGALALLAILGVYGWKQMLVAEPGEPATKAGWNLATRSSPAFAISQFDLFDKTEAYEIFRHPLGGRKDAFRWASSGEPAIAALEIYRPGGEYGASGPADAGAIAAPGPQGAGLAEAAGVIDSKFGKVMLYRQAGTNDARPCLGFIKAFDEPPLQISGWSCQGDTLPAERLAIGCLLSRLILLTAGNDPKLAELFARAELRRGDCTAAASADWVSAAETPGLRGAF